MQASDDCRRVAPNVDDRSMNGSEQQQAVALHNAARRRLGLWNRGGVR